MTEINADLDHDEDNLNKSDMSIDLNDIPQELSLNDFGKRESMSKNLNSTSFYQDIDNKYNES